ncbi:hypothetical protein PsYK624_023120 [Phanerochaete sordida]|uniref:Uncharacterized protein n=1 Tax=Phanerochaete sordida TaxID=48140 RepID=A0A9P3L9Z2_9APHY|nr:hypothetical protein PsYK624_023120 [Phanerochaete sordida]
MRERQSVRGGWPPLCFPYVDVYSRTELPPAQGHAAEALHKPEYDREPQSPSCATRQFCSDPAEFAQKPLTASTHAHDTAG